MQNPRTISELLKRGKTLSQLRHRAADRARVLDHVRRRLPARLALEVLSAGMDGDRLTVGVLPRSGPPACASMGRGAGRSQRPPGRTGQRACASGSLRP